MINLFRIVVFLAALSFCFSLEQITEKHRNGMPHFVKTFSIVKDKLVLQKETEFDRSGQKVLEQTYSNGALVSKSKWDENGEKTIIRYKNKWTKKEISTFDDYECMEAEGQRCGCMRDIVLDNLSYEEYYLLLNLKGPDAPDMPQELKKKVGSIRKKIKKECENNSSASVLDAKNQIKNLHQSVQSYYTRFGSMPGDCYEEMENRGTIEMSQKVIDAWEFWCDWEFDRDAKEVTGQITATSTESYDAGPGKQIIYDIFTGEYTGYQQGLVKQESRNRDKNKYSYDLGDNYSDRDGYEVVHSYDFVEEHLMEIVRVAGNFYYSQGWLPSIDELIGIERLRLDKAFLDYWSINVDWWISEGDLYGYIYGESKEGEFSFNVSNRNLEYYKY